MSFDRLHPAIQHHVVNSLGWRSLRDLQEASIGPVISGDDVLILGPTAGGKTEAAALPLLSRMIEEEWGGLSVLYISPLRALANNIELRLGSLFELVGRQVAAWHGDVGQGRRKAILREPPNLLVTTPESIEVMLVSTKVEHHRLFREVRAIVIDEIHSFGADDRGWHLLSVVSRLERLVGRRFQRVGLSATVGNPEHLLGWLRMEGDNRSNGSGATVVQGERSRHHQADLRADHVGSLSNAAKVVAGLHHGEKRLVFCDSRSEVERLAAALRELGTNTFVSHSSLSRDERRQAESAFADGSNCVIVSTSTLELGIDVGDLDRVIQINAPSSVASFLQRMGRTGRREGATPNILFLTTKTEDLLRACALGLLWNREYVEPIQAPPEPRHIVAQQLLALCLQERQVGEAVWFEWIRRAGLASQEQAGAIAAHMCSRSLVEGDAGMLFVGETAERLYGHKHFMELLSVFTTPPLVELRHGREHLGTVHESSFIVRNQQQPVLLLAGRSWALEEIDWARRIAYVVPAADTGESRWIGSGQPLTFELCRAMRDVVCGDDPPIKLSRRAGGELARIRGELQWARREVNTLVKEQGRTRWWTFAGTLANRELEWRLGDLTETSRGSDELSIPVVDGTTSTALREALDSPNQAQLPIDSDAVRELKFSDCLPLEIAEAVLRERVRDSESVDIVRREGFGNWTDANQ